MSSHQVAYNIVFRLCSAQLIRRTCAFHATGDFAGEASEYTISVWNGSVVDARDVEGFRGSPGRPASPRDV